MPAQAYSGREDSRSLEVPRFRDNRHMKVVSLSAYTPAAFTPPPSQQEIFLTPFC